MALRRRFKKDVRGQAITEYILMVAIVTLAFVLVQKGLKDISFAEKITKPIFEQYAHAYRYGHVKAKGFDDGGPENHPRAIGGNGNFRIFINPK